MLDKRSHLKRTIASSFVSIYREADRFDRLFKNLLDMMRIEAGAVQLNKEWHPLDEIVGAALTRLEERLRIIPFVPVFPLIYRWCKLTGCCLSRS